MRIIKAKVGTMIQLGKIGSSETTQVIFDVSGWTDDLSGYSFELIHQRYGDEEPYPVGGVEYSEDDQTVTWTVANSDVAVAGWGKAELILVAGSAVAKSQTFGTVVHKALGELLDPPEEYQTWVDKVLAAGSAAKVSAEAAAESATNAATSETNAAEFASAASGYATSASNSATEASGYAETAKTKAGEASDSAKAASDSEIAAGESELAAKGYAESASGSAGTATSKASEASGYAATASNKASEASGYASNAKDAQDAAEKAESETKEIASQALTDISTAKTEAVEAVTEEGANQVQKVKDEGATYQSEIDALEETTDKLNEDLTHIKDMTSEEEQSGTYAKYHLGFYLDENGELCELED